MSNESWSWKKKHGGEYCFACIHVNQHFPSSRGKLRSFSKFYWMFQLIISGRPKTQHLRTTENIAENLKSNFGEIWYETHTFVEAAWKFNHVWRVLLTDIQYSDIAICLASEQACFVAPLLSKQPRGLDSMHPILLRSVIDTKRERVESSWSEEGRLAV